MRLVFKEDTKKHICLETKDEMTGEGKSEEWAPAGGLLEVVTGGRCLFRITA